MPDDKKKSGNGFLIGLLAGVAATFIGGILLEGAIASWRERRRLREAGRLEEQGFFAIERPAAGFEDWR